MKDLSEKELQILKSYQDFPKIWQRIHAEMDKRIIGHDEVIDHIISAIFCRGHCLLVGVPGLAKTYIIRTLAAIMDLDFKRVQFTPDLMPSDITGSEMLQVEEDGKRKFTFVKGPIFTQLLLADEINRTPPKTQAALLEAMQERHVTVMGRSSPLKEPFFVLATQNPLEQEGTYRLPEAELDRFIFSLKMDYTSFDDEVKITLSTTKGEEAPVDKVIDATTIQQMQQLVHQVPISDSVSRFIVQLVRATRPQDKKSPEIVNRYVKWGAGPRACQGLAVAGKVNALLAGRANVSKEDIIKAAVPVLNHRILLNFHAEADKESVESILEKIIGGIK